MRHIYLDQKDWIALARAANGKPDQPEHADVLTLLRPAVEAGNVSLPLSHVHYQETSHRKPYAKRLELATVMAALSRLHTIAPFYRLSKEEMRYVIASHPEQFEGPITVQPPPVPSGAAATTPSAIPRLPAAWKASRKSSGPLRAGPMRQWME